MSRNTSGLDNIKHRLRNANYLMMYNAGNTDQMMRWATHVGMLLHEMQSFILSQKKARKF